MGDEVDVDMVAVKDLKVGDEVEDFGKVSAIDGEGRCIAVTFRLDRNGVGGGSRWFWPVKGSVPVVRKPRKQRRTVVIDYPAGRDVPTIGTGVARWDDSVVVSDEVTEVDA